MSFTSDTIWPLRLDLCPLECRQILREKELLCYSDVVSVFRAQGPLSDEKKSVLIDLQKLFSITDERHKAELRRAANNEKLSTIAEIVSGFSAYSEWASFGALKMPPTIRPKPRKILCNSESQTLITTYDNETQLPSPSATNDATLAEKYNEAIANNRATTISAPVTVSCSTSTENSVKTVGIATQDYNLHLLSEIATGESTQTEDSADNDITLDPISFQPQNDDIELSSTPGTKVTTNIGQKTVNQQRNLIGQHVNQSKLSTSSINNQKQSAQQTSLTTLPLSNQLGTAWTGQLQQVYLQNVSPQHSYRQKIENINSLGYALQQRMVKTEQQQQKINTKQHLIVRNLGSQPTLDTDRNKRFTVVKGGVSFGPTTKKPKMSNPSNRQPGRPPLMPAPSSVYASRPYIANSQEIFHTGRVSTVRSPLSSTEPAPADAHRLRITSVHSSSGNSRGVVMTSSLTKPNPYYSVGCGGIGPSTSSSSTSSSVVQLGIPSIDGCGLTNTLRAKDRINCPSILSINQTESHNQ